MIQTELGTSREFRVARTSKRRNRRAATTLLFLISLALVATAVAKLKEHEILTGIELLGWAFLPLGLILGFTMPVQCRVMTTRGTACGNEAYGLLFGCNKAGHAFNKFRARLHLQSNAATAIRHARPVADVGVMYHLPPGSEPLKVSIADTVLSRCGVWAGIISAAGTLIGVILTVMYHGG
jgi:hypothetical protein